ncbi:hypothetical protein H4582DRAFT_2060807 [Lactarius indigo]|nr:hypothetical protein H4582DRAFT_2060807 [Lactarius indigo]
MGPERRWAEVSDKGKSRVGRGGSPYNTGTHGAETGSPELLVAGGGSRLRGPWAQRPERDVERRSRRKQSATQIKPRPPEADAKKKKKARKSRVVPAGFTADVQPQPRSSFPPKKKETRERRNIDKPQPQVVPLGDNRPRESDILARAGLGEKRVRTRGEWRARILQRGGGDAKGAGVGAAIRPCTSPTRSCIYYTSVWTSSRTASLVSGTPRRSAARRISSQTQKLSIELWKHESKPQQEDRSGACRERSHWEGSGGLLVRVSQAGAEKEVQRKNAYIILSLWVSRGKANDELCAHVYAYIPT